ncbi:MAG: FAD-dependent oxidoreductase, partial [Hyphomicrobiaceae bacterium]
TEPHPKIKERHAKGLPEMGVLREADSSWYMREEAGGLLLGPYEKGAPCCYVDGPSEQSEYELFQEDLDRLAPHIETAIARVPAFGEVGIKKVYNGAIAYTPDGSPIIGPAWDLKNFWLNEGHSFGVTAAGGAGWQLAEWIVDGEPTLDMMGVDPRRFGPYASKGYLVTKNEEAYANVFTPHYPDEERIACRPLKQTPCYDRMKALGAVFGTVYGWERPGWFAPKDLALTAADLQSPDVLTNHNHAPPTDDGRIVEKWSFRRANYFQHVGNECLNVRDNVGLQDMSAFAKCWISGPGAEAWLDGLFANKIPKRVGRLALCHMLTKHGGVRAEFTVYRTGEHGFYLVSAGAYERHDHDYLRKALPADGSVTMAPITTQWGVLVLAGPKSRDVLARVTNTDLSNKAFPWLSGQRIDVMGKAKVPAWAHAVRVNFVGELGWEFHHPVEHQNAIFDALMEAGADFGIKPYGIKAMSSLSVEKSYRLIGRELSIEYSAYESGLDRFVHLNKGEFIGRDALVAGRAKGLAWNFVTMEVMDVTDAGSDARGSEPIHDKAGKLVGRATNGAYGWRCGKSLALAMVQPEFAAAGTELDITILGEKKRAVVVGESPWDGENGRLRG